MKKKLGVGLLILVMLIGTFAVYADSSDNKDLDRGYGYTENNQRFQSRRECIGHPGNFSEEEREEWSKKTQEEREEYREENIKRNLEEGIMTEEEANQCRTNFAEREKFREENGLGKGHHNGGGHHHSVEEGRRNCHNGRRGRNN